MFSAKPSLLGTRRCVVKIQAQSSIPDEFGQPQTVWTDVCTLQTRIRQATQREIYQAGQLTSQVTHVIEAWWLPVRIAAGMRALYGTAHTYLIQAVENVEQRNKDLNLFVLEIDGSST